MKKRNLYLIVAAAGLFLGLRTATAEDLYCPSVPGPYPKPAEVLEEYVDEKGGKWKLICTNASQYGDFAWVYEPVGGPLKAIGRCVFVEGQNRSREIIDDDMDGNVDSFYHICYDGGDPDANSKCEAVVNIFYKEECVKYRLCMNYVDGQWVEDVPRRVETTAENFENRSADNNSDGIPDAGFQQLVNGVFNMPPGDLPAEKESKNKLKSKSEFGNVRVEWDMDEPAPTLTPGDYIIIRDLSTGNIVQLDPRFTASNTTAGLRLTANTGVTPVNGESPVTLDPPPSLMTTHVRYAIVDVGARDFYDAFLAQVPLNTPINDIMGSGWSSSLNFVDAPGYASAMGTLLMAVAIPAVSEWGVVVMVLLVLTAATVVYSRRNAPKRAA